jgi:hypothetical protein
MSGMEHAAFMPRVFHPNGFIGLGIAIEHFIE